MAKAEIIDINSKKEFQVRNEMSMSPRQRIDLVFELMDLMIEMSPNKRIESLKRDDISWIELKLKNDFA